MGFGFRTELGGVATHDIIMWSLSGKNPFHIQATMLGYVPFVYN